MTNEYDGRNGNGYQPLPSESKGIAAPPRERVTDAELASHAANNLIAAEQTIAELRAQLAALEGQEPFMWVRVEDGCIEDYTLDKGLASMWMQDEWPVTQALYAKPVPAAQQPVEVMLFQLKHPDTGESRTVAFTRSDIADGMEDVIFEKLGDLICDCQPVGETNVVDCNCGDYIDEFELVNAAPQPPVQQPLSHCSDYPNCPNLCCPPGKCSRGSAVQQESDCPHGVDDGACKECHAEQAPAQDALRKRFDEIEFEVAQGRHTAASVFTQMRTAVMSTRPAQTEQKPVAVVEFSDFQPAAAITGDEPRRVAVRALFDGALRVGDMLYAAPIQQTASPAAQDVNGLVAVLREIKAKLRYDDPLDMYDKVCSALSAYQAAQKDGEV